MCQERSRKGSFHHCAGPVKLVQACISVRKDLESSYHHSGSLVRLVKSVYEPEKTYKAVFTTVEAL